MSTAGARAFLGVVLSLLTPYAATAKNVQQTGVLVRRVAGMLDAAPCPGTFRAWVWSTEAKSRGLFLAHSDGTLINPSSPLLSQLSIIDVFTTPGNHGAWARTADPANTNTHRLYFIDRCEPGASTTLIDDIQLGSKYHLITRGGNTKSPSIGMIWTSPQREKHSAIIEGAKTFHLPASPHHIPLRISKDNQTFWRPEPGKKTWTIAAYDTQGRERQRISDKNNCISGLGTQIAPINTENVWILSPRKTNHSSQEHQHTLCIQQKNKGLQQVDTLVSSDIFPTIIAINEHQAWLFLGGTTKAKRELYLFTLSETGTLEKSKVPATEILGTQSGSNSIWLRSESGMFIATPHQKSIERHDISPLDGVDAQAAQWLDPRGGAWLESSDGIRTMTANGQWSSPLLLGHEVRLLSALPDLHGAWVHSLGIDHRVPPGIFVIRDIAASQEQLEVQVQLSGATLNPTDVRSKATCGSIPITAKVSLKWQGTDTAGLAEAAGVVTLELKGKDEWSRPAVRTLRDGDELSIPSFQCTPGTHSVRLRYSDDHGSQVTFVWPSVEFESNFWQRKDVRTILAFVALIFITALVATFRPRRLRLSAWLPGIAVVITSSAEYSFLGPLQVDFLLLGRLVAAAALLGLVAGVSTPRAFREMAEIAPYDRILPLVILAGPFRRRLLREYVARIRNVLSEQRKAATGEAFVPIPALVEDYPETQVARAPALRLPLPEIVAVLTGEIEQRAHVLIEAPPGRGKSALLRATVEALLDAFETFPTGPLPVLCPKAGDDVEGLVRDELGRHGFSDAVVKIQLQRGLFILVIDALDESNDPAAFLKRIVTGPYEDTRLLVASRPSAARRDALSHADRWKRVEPAQLDSVTVKTFEATYLQADFNAGIRSHPLDERVRTLCQTEAGGYSALLVRFAMRVDGNEIKSILSLYEQVLRLLLRPAAPTTADPLIVEAGALCKDIHWTTGQREFTSAEVVKHQAIFNELKKASIIVPADEARFTFRFFHASVQSFLTARWLAPIANGDVLAAAAGDRKFLQERSDLLGHPGSDLFYFLVYAMSEQVARTRLIQKLTDWNGTIGNELGRSLIITASPVCLRADFATWVTHTANDKSSSFILAELLSRVSSLAAPQGLTPLLDLFAAIAPAGYAQESQMPKPNIGVNAPEPMIRQVTPTNEQKP